MVGNRRDAEAVEKVRAREWRERQTDLFDSNAFRTYGARRRGWWER